jgi:prophage antirepressor-like protein
MSAISLFEEKQVRRAWNSSEEKWYFSVDDVVLALTDTVNVKDYIKKLRKRDLELDSYWGTNCPPVEMIATDGKKRKIKAANTESLLRIIQSVPSPKAEPFKRWLGEASTTEIAKKHDAQGFPQNQQAAKAGGTIAGDARKALETKSGHKISTPENYKSLAETQKRITRKKS